ncbi:MAG: PEGA domain-containing protein [Bryobacterales bacterium]|nr:PEGA domain-containing protein [Bryobacterales bacterium]
MFVANEPRLAEAIHVKAVPVTLVPTRAAADYELTVKADGDAGGWVRLPFRKAAARVGHVEAIDVRTNAVVYKQTLPMNGSSLQRRRAAEAVAADLDRQIRKGGRRPEVESHTQTTSVRITSAPSYAELEVDGVFWGVTPTAELTRLLAGPHTLVVKKPGYQPWVKKVDLALGETVALNAELVEAGAVAGRSRVAGLD